VTYLKFLANLAAETFGYIPKVVGLALLVVITLSAIVWGTSFGATLLAMSVVAFFQNMAFTAVSRSRNSADTAYHRKCAWASNGIWLLCQLFIWKHLWLAFSTGTFVQLVPLILVYVFSTTEGSVSMMERAIRTETGRRRVGAQK
jgi:hypothetical protein